MGKTDISIPVFFPVVNEHHDDHPAPPNLVGTELSATDLAALESRWVDRPLAESAFLRRVDSWTGAQLVGRKGGDYAGIAIPYFAPGDRHVREYRLRRDHPDLEADSGGQLKVKQKYLSPQAEEHALPAARLRCRAAGNSELPLIITEGEFKTLASGGWQMFGVQNDPRFLPVGISGVFNWRGTVGKATAPDGQRLNVKGPILDLDWITWKGRKVIIAFDADAP